MAVTARTGAYVDIPNGVAGSGRSGRAQDRRIKVIVRHLAASARGPAPDSPAPPEPARC
ncbi:hypothetical protein [Streptomyces vinaceus]|uniref:hypothetical protein n=1 Tax=Streptomyces vinaceus TaxID=1960 RepID=UPI0037FA0B7E